MKRRVTVGLLAVFLFLLNTKAHSTDDSNSTGIVSLVHVGIGVSDLTKALHFYIDQLGFKEAFRLNKADGSPMLIYLKVRNSDTFVELFPNAKNPLAPAPPMVYHMGFMVEDLQAALHALKNKGYPLPDDAFDKASKIAGDGTVYYFVNDPDGNHIELSQLGPECLQVKAAPGLLKKSR
jgi:lactoylglutathione lyase